VYKSTFFSVKNSPKNRPRLIHGSKTDVKKCSGQIFRVTMAYLKENSKVKDKFFEKILTQKTEKKHFLAPNGGPTYIRDRLIHK